MRINPFLVLGNYLNEWFHLLVIVEIHSAELPDRSVGSASVLPVSAKDKDIKLKEENTRLLNSNSGDSADRVWDNKRFIMTGWLRFC